MSIDLESLSPQERACLIQITQRAFAQDPKRYSLVCGSTLTSGAWWVAKTSHCFWLMELIALAQYEPEVNAAPWQAWRIALNADQGHERAGEYAATVSAKDENGTPLFSRDILRTDFLFPEFNLIALRNQDSPEAQENEDVAGVTIMLPSEF